MKKLVLKGGEETAGIYPGQHRNVTQPDISVGWKLGLY